MRRAGPLRFWGSAVAALAAWLLPYRALGLDSAALRWQAWLLTVWTAGVIAICFGLAGLVGYGAPLGVREVAEAGSLTGAMEARRLARRGTGARGGLAGWLIATGAALVGIYFVAWSLH